MVMRITCKWCQQGNTPNEKGEHWITKSVNPARIEIRECKIARVARDAENANKVMGTKL